MEGPLTIEAVCFVIVTHVLKFTGGTECLKNSDIGWRTGNIYACDNPEYPECCEVYKEFTCCEYAHVKHLREQLQLWGSVTLISIIVIVAFVYLTVDLQFFSRPTLRDGVQNIKSKFRRGKKEQLPFKFPEEPQPHCSKDYDSFKTTETLKLNVYNKTQQV